MERAFRHLCGIGTLALCLLVMAGCGGTTVRIVYRPSPDLDPRTVDHDCVRRVGAMHVHTDWLSFERIDMTPKGDVWEVIMRGVPVDAEHHFRLNDPDACGIDPNGAVTTGITVNEVPLSRVVGTPGAGTEPGLAFTVDKNGKVGP